MVLNESENKKIKILLEQIDGYITIKVLSKKDFQLLLYVQGQQQHFQDNLFKSYDELKEQLKCASKHSKGYSKKCLKRK